MNAKTYEWSNDPALTPIDNEDLSVGLKYTKFKVELSNSIKESWEIINAHRTIGKGLERSRICYENINMRGGWYTLLIPNMDETAILSVEGIGFKPIRLYTNISRKYRRMNYQKIRL